MSNKLKNENIFRAARKFSDAFFDGLKTGAVDRIIQQAKRKGMDDRAIRQMQKIKKEKDELDRILSDIPEPSKPTNN